MALFEKLMTLYVLEYKLWNWKKVFFSGVWCDKPNPAKESINLSFFRVSILLLFFILIPTPRNREKTDYSDFKAGFLFSSAPKWPITFRGNREKCRFTEQKSWLIRIVGTRLNYYLLYQVHNFPYSYIQFYLYKFSEMGMKFLLLGAVLGVLGQKYLDMRNHSFREMREYLQLIKYTCPGL